MSSTWIGVVPELIIRGQGLIADSGGKLYLSEGFRTRAEQEFFYQRYLAGGSPAARPGTSKHEKGLAIDIGGSTVHPELVRTLAKKWGLKQTVASEIWHYELDPNRKALPEMPAQEEYDDMSKFVYTYRYPNGRSVIRVTERGEVYCYGLTYRGGIPNVPTAQKVSWQDGECIVMPLNPQDPEAGYEVHSENDQFVGAFTPQWAKENLK